MNHPGPEILARYQSGQLPPAELLAVDDHLSVCPDCRQRLSHSGAHRLFAAAASPLASPSPQPSRPRLAPWAGLAFAAAATVAFLLWPRPAAQVAIPAAALRESPLMGPGEPDGFTLLLPAPGALVPSRPEFRWSSPELDATFQLTIVDSNGAIVLESPLLKALSWTASQPLAPGRYQWQVRSGNRLAPQPPAPAAYFFVESLPPPNAKKPAQ